MHTTDVQVTLEIAGEQVRINVWKVQVGRVPLYLLDTNVEGNSPEAAAITNRLYGGDTEHRLRQEMVLGIGGVRVLRALVDAAGCRGRPDPACARIGRAAAGSARCGHERCGHL